MPVQRVQRGRIKHPGQGGSLTQGVSWSPWPVLPRNALQPSQHHGTPQAPALPGTQGGNWPRELGGEAQGWLHGARFLDLCPRLVPSHLLWSQSLLHPLVLDAGDLVEEAVAVELQALVELAVRQPLPGKEGEAGLSPQGLGGTQGLARDSSPMATAGIAGAGPRSPGGALGRDNSSRAELLWGAGCSQAALGKASRPTAPRHDAVSWLSRHGALTP